MIGEGHLTLRGGNALVSFEISSEQIATGILASVEACRDVVTAFANHKLPAPKHGPKIKHSDLRAAPGFARGKNLDAPGSVLYTSRDVAEILAVTAKAPSILQSGGKGAPLQAGKWVMVGMALLEHFEEFPFEEAEILTRIKNCEPGYQVVSLLKRLREHRKLTNVFASAGNEAKPKRSAVSAFARKK